MDYRCKHTFFCIPLYSPQCNFHHLVRIPQSFRMLTLSGLLSAANATTCADHIFCRMSNTLGATSTLDPTLARHQASVPECRVQPTHCHTNTSTSNTFGNPMEGQYDPPSSASHRVESHMCAYHSTYRTALYSLLCPWNLFNVTQLPRPHPKPALTLQGKYPTL